MAPLDEKSALDLSAVRRDVAEAHGLPNACYLSPEIHELEKRRIFVEGWAGVGFAHSVPEPGDALPIDFLGQPLLLLRDRAGQLRLYQNTCRHRGMILVDAPRKIEGAIRCPYHSWCYALDGRLVSTPHVGGPGQNLHPGVKREELGLIEIRTHVWFGVVFANISGDAPPFEEVHGELLKRWAEFDRPIFHSGADSSFKLEVETNWKLAVENYCESYHLPWVHPGLNSYSRLEDHYNIVEYGRYSGQGTRVYRPQLSPDGRRFPDFDGLSEQWMAGAEYLTLFPNVMLGAHRDHLFAILLEPKGPDRTVEHVEIFYAREEAMGEAFAEMRATNSAMWKEVFVEDIGVVEGMQRGRRGVRFDGGRFSPAMDPPTHVFHDWIAARMDGAG